MARRVKRGGRPGWKQIVTRAESVLGRSWNEMSAKYGDWGRDAVIAVSQRHLGWRLMEVVREIPGLKYPAAAQAAKRFWLGMEADPEKQSFVEAMRRGFS